MASRQHTSLGALLAFAASTPALAADPHFVATGGPTQATIVDLTSRTQAEAVLSFTATLLRRTPAHLADMDAYWGDGTLQIDCLNHLTRWRVTTGRSLDRSRRFDAPNPAFGAWSPDGEGTVALSLERYVCHGAPSPDVSAVADIAGFARAYLGGQTVAQAGAVQAGGAQGGGADAPPAARSAPAPAEAAAPAASGGLATYYMTDRDQFGAEVVDMSSRHRKGAVVSLGLYRLKIEPMHTAGGDYRWEQYDAEFDCAGHRERRALRSLLSIEDHRKGAFPRQAFFAWEPMHPAQIEPLVCEGRAAPGVMAVDDLLVFQRWYLSSVGAQ